MNSKQEGKLKMYLTLRIFLRANPTILATLPNIEEFLTLLDNAILLIQNNIELQQHLISGETVDKKQIRSILVKTTLDNSLKIQAYAKYTNNVKLLTDVKFSNTYLKTISDLALLAKAKNLYHNISNYLLEVDKYGLTSATQTTFNSDIQTFENVIPSKRQSEIDHKERNKLLIKGFNDAAIATAQIDSVIEIIHLSEPDFYATYKETRKVVDLGGAGSNVLKGTVVDADTKTAIEGATVAFMHKNSTVVILTKLSAAKGGFIDKTLDEGDYTVTISKVGYKTMTTYVTVDYSKTISMAIVLSKNND